MPTLRLRKKAPPEKITIKEAAKLMGVSEARLRVAILQGSIDIGFVTKTKKGYHVYTVYKKKVEKYVQAAGY